MTANSWPWLSRPQSLSVLLPRLVIHRGCCSPATVIFPHVLHCLPLLGSLPELAQVCSRPSHSLGNSGSSRQPVLTIECSLTPCPTGPKAPPSLISSSLCSLIHWLTLRLHRQKTSSLFGCCSLSTSRSCLGH